MHTLKWKRMVWATVLIVSVVVTGVALAYADNSSREDWSRRGRGWLRCPDTHRGISWQEDEQVTVEGTISKVHLEPPFPEIIIVDTEGNDMYVALHPVRFFSADDFAVGETIELTGVFREVYGTEVLFVLPDWAEKEEPAVFPTRRGLQEPDIDQRNEEHRRFGMTQKDDFRRGR